MANITSEEYFEKLKKDRLTYEREISSLSDDPYMTNKFCIEEENKYKEEVFDIAVKIYNNLESDEAKKVFRLKVVNLFSELGKDKSKSILAQYNECKNIFDAIRGVLLAKNENMMDEEIDKLLTKSYQFMRVPFVKNEEDSLIHLKNNVYDVMALELEYKNQMQNSLKC